MIQDQIKKIFAETPGGHPSNWEALRLKKAILLLAQHIDLQQGEFVSTNKIAREIIEGIDKLDEKFEKAGL